MEIAPSWPGDPLVDPTIPPERGNIVDFPLTPYLPDTDPYLPDTEGRPPLVSLRPIVSYPETIQDLNEPLVRDQTPSVFWREDGAIPGQWDQPRLMRTPAPFGAPWHLGTTLTDQRFTQSPSTTSIGSGGKYGVSRARIIDILTRIGQDSDPKTVDYILSNSDTRQKEFVNEAEAWIKEQSIQAAKNQKLRNPWQTTHKKDVEAGITGGRLNENQNTVISAGDDPLLPSAGEEYRSLKGGAGGTPKNRDGTGGGGQFRRPDGDPPITNVSPGMYDPISIGPTWLGDPLVNETRGQFSRRSDREDPPITNVLPTEEEREAIIEAGRINRQPGIVDPIQPGPDPTWPEDWGDLWHRDRVVNETRARPKDDRSIVDQHRDAVEHRREIEDGLIWNKDDGVWQPIDRTLDEDRGIGDAGRHGGAGVDTEGETIEDDTASGETVDETIDETTTEDTESGGEEEQESGEKWDWEVADDTQAAGAGGWLYTPGGYAQARWRTTGGGLPPVKTYTDPTSPYDTGEWWSNALGYDVFGGKANVPPLSGGITGETDETVENTEIVNTVRNRTWTPSPDDAKKVSAIITRWRDDANVYANDILEIGTAINGTKWRNRVSKVGGETDNPILELGAHALRGIRDVGRKAINSKTGQFFKDAFNEIALAQESDAEGGPSLTGLLAQLVGVNNRKDLKAKGGIYWDNNESFQQTFAGLLLTANPMAAAQYANTFKTTFSKTLIKGMSDVGRMLGLGKKDEKSFAKGLINIITAPFSAMFKKLKPEKAEKAEELLADSQWGAIKEKHKGDIDADATIKDGIGDIDNEELKNEYNELIAWMDNPWMNPFDVFDEITKSWWDEWVEYVEKYFQNKDKDLP